MAKIKVACFFLGHGVEYMQSTVLGSDRRSIIPNPNPNPSPSEPIIIHMQITINI